LQTHILTQVTHTNDRIGLSGRIKAQSHHLCGFATGGQKTFIEQPAL